MDLRKWHAASARAREVFSHQLLARLPAGASFVGLRTYALGGLRGDAAVFDLVGRHFVYVPGGEVEIGFDVDRWRPTEAQRESYRDSAEDYGFTESLEAYVGARVRPRRTVSVPSLLVEQETQEPGWTPISEPEARAEMGEHFPDPPANVQLFRGPLRVRCSVDEGGVAYARGNGETREDIQARILPFRLPTSDEWEHLAGGGATTLFRWGDETPADLYPNDVSHAAKAWLFEKMRRGGDLAYPAEGFEPEFDLHERPNAFGVLVSGDPYKTELVSNGHFVRGGDGGVAICGGAGFFLGWLPLATAYEDPELLEELGLGRGAIDGDYVRVRRVLEVEMLA